MKRLLVLIWLLVLAGTLVLAGGTSEAPAAAGEPSGKVVIYTSMYEDIIEALSKRVAQQLPNIKVEFFYGGTGTLQAKIAAEKAAGKLGCDMLMVAEPSYSLELKEMGLLQPIKVSSAAKLSLEYDPEGYWYPVRILNMVLAYNPEKYKKANLPNSFYAFAYNKSVAGAISMPNPLTSGTALAAISALRDKYGYEYYKGLGEQRVMVESGSVALTKLETGECKVVMILEESVLQRRQIQRSKLEVIYPTDGTINIPSTIMSINDRWSAHKNSAAAAAVTEWFLSLKGQEGIVAGWMHSVRKDFPHPPYDSIPGSEIMKNVLPVNWDRTFRERGEMRTKFQEAVMVKK